jgi:hypothetical protein
MPIVGVGPLLVAILVRFLMAATLMWLPPLP